MTRYFMMLLYQCVLTLVLFGALIHADGLKIPVTNVDIPADIPAQTQAEHSDPPAQLTETVSTVQESETIILATSLTTSQHVDQSESSIINEGAFLSTQVEASFSEIRGTSQPSELVTQSTPVDQSETVSGSSEQDALKESKESVEVPEPVQVEQQNVHVSVGDTEVKVLEKVKDTVTDEAVKESEADDSATQFKKEEDKERILTEPAVNVPSQPSASQARVDGDKSEVGGDKAEIGETNSEPVGDKTEVGGDKQEVGGDKQELGGDKQEVGGDKQEVGGKTEGGQSEDKSDEEGLTFNEWTQKVLAEAEKGKLEAQDDSQNIPLPPVKQRKKKNYASQECGAKILTSNPEASSPKSVLNSNRDEYMNNPCKAKKWFVIELCEPIQAHSIDIASLELFSSQPKKFKVLLSDRYPTKDWRMAGEFDLKDERAVQTFTITEAQDYFAKFVRVELVEHYGNEHFCPLTIFRVLGIAVIDYEDDHPDNVDDDNDEDNDENSEVEAEEGSKNLFTSAKDTVINIVKKVLNVESEEEKLLQNATKINLPSDADNTSLNETVMSEAGDTLPCVPEANVQTDKKDPACTGKKRDVHTTDDTMPHAAEPGKTDSVIVVKLEDHEQVETAPDKTPRKTLNAQINECFLAMSTVAGVKKQHSNVLSKLCEFIYIIKQQSAIQDFSKAPLKKTIKASDVSEDKVKVVDSTDNSFTSKEVKSTPVSVEGTTQKSSADVSMETEADIRSSASSSHIVQDDQNSESKQVSSPTEEKSKPPDTADENQSTTMKVTQSTGSGDSLTVTGSSTVSATQTVDASFKQTGSITTSVIDQSSTSESEKIQPSPTSVEIPREMTTDTTREATPVLPDDWKPDTKDILQDRTAVETKEASESTAKQTVSPDPTSVSIPAGDTKATITPPTDDSQQQPEPTNGVGIGVDDLQDDLGALDIETGEETQEQRANTTVIDDKVVVGNGGQQKRENLSLVRLPVIPSGKRESAIMRLSNRIKVLEQNVSLSSRFLEELSRRYKKQSEDMMKMLNKTMASLHNMTVEADVKNKLHEDEMTAMERRLENLTHVVHKLTQNFDSLNRQVTDRQMIWTTIEIIIIVFMLLFLHFRRRKVALPPEVRTLIESMPSKPAPPLPQRRNSLSGPATPSKGKSLGALQSGGGLQRFSSETALVSTDTDFPVVHPIDSTFKQATDAVKKKKKKKQKNLEGRLSLTNVGGPVKCETLSTQISSHQSTIHSNQSKETSQQPYNKTNQMTATSLSQNSRGNQLKDCSLQSSCSGPQPQSSCFGALLSGWSNNTTAKQRSASFGSEINTAAPSTQVGGAFHQSVQEGAKEGLGTKSQTKGFAKKLPVSGGAKVSPKMNTKMPKSSENEGSSKIILEEKWIVKGHKRQKSLPKQHYSSIETVGHTGQGQSNPAGFQGNAKHFDTTPVPYKIQRKGEIKKSTSFPVASERKFEKTPTSSRSFINGNNEFYNGNLDAWQSETGFFLDKSKSENSLPLGYGKHICTDEFLLNGHTNGEDRNESAYSGDKMNGLGCEQIEHGRSKIEPTVVQNKPVKTCQNGSWKNIFGYFK